MHFSQAPSPYGADRFPNWPEPPARAHRQMRGEHRVEVISLEGAGAGTTGAEEVALRFPTYGDRVKIKGKKVPGRLDGINNSPRRELAAYAIQRLFLDPADYVVPTTVVRCAPLEQWREHHESGSPTIPGTSCVLVAAAIWMKDVKVPDELYDEERFRSDPTYAYFMANLNLFTYLIDHRDGRSGNFLESIS